MNIKFVRNVSLQTVENLNTENPHYSDELILAGTVFNDCKIDEENPENGTFDLQIADGNIIFDIPMDFVEEAKELVNIS